MKILIAEDSEDSSAMLALALTGHGYEVMSGTNGVEALRLARATPPDLIISDIMMPEMDGFELCRQIKADHKLNKIPFIFYTATYTEHQDEELAVALGASHFLIKPLEPQVFIATIQEILTAPLSEKLCVTQQPVKEKNELNELHLHSVCKKLDKKVRTLEQEREALKKNEEKLKKFAKQLSQAQKISHLGSWELDLVNNELNCSDEMYSIFEVVPEVFGQSYDQFYDNFVDFVHPDDRELVYNEHTDSVRNRRPCDIEFRLLMKDGKIKYVNERRETTYDESGKPLLTFGTVLDITERKHSEKEREKLQEQLTNVQKMESMGRLASGIVHDFNNMIVVILGFAELALEKMEQSHPLFTDLQEIFKAANRSANLTRQLLAFARKQMTVPKVLVLNELVEEMINMLNQLIGKDIDLAWLPDADLWQIKVDPVQIEQVLTNLCVNARDAIPGVGKITVETKNVALDEAYCAESSGVVPGDYVMLCIIDDGCGMDKETHNKIFEPFFTTKGEGQGTGLGLAMVYGIVKQNNGFISADSEPGEGTTFKIYLPRYTGKSQQIQKEGLLEQVRSGNETILLVEDMPALLEMITRIFKRQGYTVLAATTPSEAISLSRKYSGQIHLLVTDVVMPEMNGRYLANELLSRYLNLKILFMSGYTADVIDHMGMLAKGSLFIQKPFENKDLIAKVREVLDSKELKL